MTSGHADQVHFSALTRPPRLSDEVADTLLETILAQGLRPGARLPSERRLAEQFGVSRTVVREAIRSLATKGVIRVQPGAAPEVGAIDAHAVTQSLSLYLRRSTIEYPKVHEIRTIVETEMAAAAAQRATDDEIAEMGAAAARMEAVSADSEAAAAADVEFHEAIARGAHNDVYLILLRAIGDALIEIRRQSLSRGSTQQTLEAHRKILDSVARRDPDAARTNMLEHLRTVLSWWERAIAPGAKLS